MMLSWLFSDPLAVGSDAPAFSLVDDSGRCVTLSDLRGRHVVLVFYPGDDTPTCTRQLCQFRDSWDQAAALGVEVFGVNSWSGRRHADFRKKFQFPFALLVDPGQKVAKAYHANGLAIKRTVYLISPGGRILFARRGVPSPAEVLAAVEG